MLPLFVNLTDRLCVVVGGGPVGRRKAAALVEGGTRVRLVCREPRPPDGIAPEVDWLTETYRAGHLDGAELVFAAATPEVNVQVAADARGRGLWVNVADDPAGSDFFMPSTLRRGEFTIAVGTGGAAPGLAREVRRLLESQFDDSFRLWVGLLGELRPVVRSSVATADQRRALLAVLCRWEWLERIRREGVDAVRAAMRAEVGSVAWRPEGHV